MNFEKSRFVSDSANPDYFRVSTNLGRECVVKIITFLRKLFFHNEAKDFLDLISMFYLIEKSNRCVTYSDFTGIFAIENSFH